MFYINFDCVTIKIILILDVVITAIELFVNYWIWTGLSSPGMLGGLAVETSGKERWGIECESHQSAPWFSLFPQDVEETSIQVYGAYHTLV